MELVTYLCDFCDNETVEHIDAVFNGYLYDLCPSCNEHLKEIFEGKGTPYPVAPCNPFLSAVRIAANIN